MAYPQLFGQRLQSVTRPTACAHLCCVHLCVACEQCAVDAHSASVSGSSSYAMQRFVAQGLLAGW